MPKLHFIRKIRSTAFWDTPIVRPGASLATYAFAGEEFEARVRRCAETGKRHETSVCEPNGHVPAERKIVLTGIYVQETALFDGLVSIVVGEQFASDPIPIEVAASRHQLFVPILIMPERPWHVRIDPFFQPRQPAPIRVTVFGGRYSKAAQED
jgi:hypothetical protein